jgi:hypothetical protein
MGAPIGAMQYAAIQSSAFLNKDRRLNAFPDSRKTPSPV